MNPYLIHDQTFTGDLGSIMGCTQNDGRLVGKKFPKLSKTLQRVSVGFVPRPRTKTKVLENVRKC
jgi:hypothetical protein